MIGNTLNEESVEGWLDERSGWKRTEGGVFREHRFDDFRDAIVFVNRVAGVAVEVDRHPEILVRFPTVRITVRSGVGGRLTAADLELAEAIDMATPRR